MEKTGSKTLNELSRIFPRRLCRTESFWQVSWLSASPFSTVFPLSFFLRTVTGELNADYSCGAASDSNGIPFSSRLRRDTKN